MVPHPFPLRPVPTRPGRVPLLYACWSPKGGSGTTVVAAALGVLLARAAPSGALLADLAGDLPTALGLTVPPTGIGLADWLAAGPDVPDDALARLEVDAGARLRLLPWRGGHGAPVTEPGRGAALAAALSRDPRAVVVDCGTAGTDAGLAVAASATVSLLVIRPCYLALRRALEAPLRPSGVVLVAEEGRSLGRADVADVLGGPGPVWVERGGALERTTVEIDTPTIEHLIEKVVSPLGLRIDRSSPLVDARLPDGSRVNAIVPPLAIDGPCLTVRRFGARAIPLDRFCPPPVGALLRRAAAI